MNRSIHRVTHPPTHPLCSILTLTQPTIGNHTKSYHTAESRSRTSQPRNPRMLLLLLLLQPTKNALQEPVGRPCLEIRRTFFHLVSPTTKFVLQNSSRLSSRLHLPDLHIYLHTHAVGESPTSNGM
jgi:hypothetical protein